MKTRDAFTLIELLVTLAIIVVLSMLGLQVMEGANVARNQAASLSNFRQLGTGLNNYIAMNDGEFPVEGESMPSWESSADPEHKDAWYNSVPRLAGALGVADYSSQRQSFYKRENPLFVAAAKYPRDKESRPYFAASINSKLRRKGQKAALLAAMERPSFTIVFQESGLPGEKTLPGQPLDKYDGQAKSYASRTVARYNGKVLVTFGDGHAACLDAKEVVNPKDGLAYFPQTGPGAGSVIWTMDPEIDPND